MEKTHNGHKRFRKESGTVEQYSLECFTRWGIDKTYSYITELYKDYEELLRTNKKLLESAYEWRERYENAKERGWDL